MAIEKTYKTCEYHRGEKGACRGKLEKLPDLVASDLYGEKGKMVRMCELGHTLHNESL